MGTCTEKELLYFLFTTDSNIFAQTLHPEVKTQRHLNLADYGPGNEHFRKNRNMGKFWRK